MMKETEEKRDGEKTAGPGVCPGTAPGTDLSSAQGAAPGQASGGREGFLTVLRRIFPVLMLLAVLLLISSRTGADGQTAEEPIYVSGFSLDTFWTLMIYEGGGEAALSHAEEVLESYDELFNQSNPASDVYRINHRTENEVKISEDMASLLETAQQFGEESGGDFDVTVGRLTELWDLKNRKTVPPEEEVQEALSYCDMDGFHIERRDGAAYFVSDDAGLQIDIGAIAKGYIADRLKEVMLADGVRSALINLGGNVLCVGGKSGTEDFTVSLRKPEKDSTDPIAALSVRDLSVVTAGIYERFFEENGVHYHHILSTKDGWPVQNELTAVSVVGPNSAYCDALSTTLFIKGTEAGTDFLRAFNEAHAEENWESGDNGTGSDGRYYAYFIGKDGSITATEGASELIKETFEGYEVRER